MTVFIFGCNDQTQVKCFDRSVATVDRDGKTIWIADAHRDDGKRLVVHADEKLTAFIELELAIRAYRKRK